MGSASRHIASSPAPYTESFHETDDDDLRLMKCTANLYIARYWLTRPLVKVHYTFDNESKTNHLVRWRQEEKIRTAWLDETTQVGVVELKTCINAIVSASPELVARLGQDYTIYAYDYSEYETPLVGQGMLSWALASSTPSAPAEQSSTLVTGRVCKTLGLFSGGAPETLEVKLRLVPVPTALQSEYIESMNKYRDLSTVIPEGFDFRTWNDFLKANPGMLAVLQNGNRPSTNEAPSNTARIERVQRLMNQGYGPTNGQQIGYDACAGSTFGVPDSGESVRGGSPAPSVQSAPMMRTSSSRPASRMSVSYPDQPRTRQKSATTAPDSGYVSNDERVDESRPKKRAKVTQVNRPGKGNLNQNVDSLRVAASSAASVRVYQPIAIRPPGNHVKDLEEPPRAPTPIPSIANPVRVPRLTAYKSNFRHESSAATPSEYPPPYISQSHAPSFPDSTATSPESGHVTNANDCPEEPGSSPPMIPDNMTCQSSPALPPLHPRDRAKLTGGRLDDSSADENDDGDGPVEGDELESVRQFNNRFQSVTSLSGNVNVLNTHSRPGTSSNTGKSKEAQEALSRENARRAISLKRSQTWSGNFPSSEPVMISDSAQDDQASANGSEQKPKGKRRSKWDKEKRIASQQSKLTDSISMGRLPPYCEVCGAIETPTWRKAYAKKHSGSHAAVVISREPGGVVCYEVLETNEDGSTKLFRIFKKTLLETDYGFVDILLCNPCGLWLVNRNKLRPKELWNAVKPKDDSRPSRPPRPRRKKANSGLYTDSLEPQPDMASDGLAVAAQEDSGLSPTESETMTGLEGDGEPESTAEIEGDGEPELPSINRLGSADGACDIPSQSEGNNDCLLDPAAYAALQRAIQSSPNRLRVSKSSPIGLKEGTPDPARRSLFSSPKTRGPLGVDPNEHARSKPVEDEDLPLARNDTGPEAEVQHMELIEEPAQQSQPVRSLTPDFFRDLTEALAPVTPSKSNVNRPPKTPSDAFKTPSNKSSRSQQRISTNDFFSSAAKAFLHGPRTPSRTPSKSRNPDNMTPFSRNLSILLSESLGQPQLDSSPGKFLLGDGRSLPPLSTDVNAAMDFDFSEFNATSELGLTSSPPRWFGPLDDATEGGVWEDVAFESSPAAGSEKENGGTGEKEGAVDAGQED